MRRRSRVKTFRTDRGTRAESAFAGRRLHLESLEDRRLLTRTVTTQVDENDGIGAGGVSLRDALSVAIAGETINFADSLTSGGPATLTLTLGQLQVTKSLNIVGPGSNKLTISAAAGNRIFNVDDGVSGALL